MIFLNSKIITKQFFFMNAYLNVKIGSLILFLFSVCNNTNLTAQIRTNPVLQTQTIILPNPPPIQNGAAGNVNPILNEAVGQCGLEEAIEERYTDNPELLKQRQKNYSRLVQEVDSIVDHRKRFPQRIDNIVIPVVFHYFYEECVQPFTFIESAPVPVFTNERFENAIQILNEDFDATTSSIWEAAGNSLYGIPQMPGSIRFRLAELDPNGNPTNGINRISNNITHAGAGNDTRLRQIVQWPRDTYLNIYVVETVKPNGTSGVGFYPEDSHAANELLDGVTIARWALDPEFNDGIGLPARNDYRAILSHEVGHWLGLRHVWGDPGDTGYGGSNYCVTDDFDFYNALISSNPGEFTLSINDLNDTPNTNFQTNWTNCSQVTACGNIDYNLNIMDYSPCSVLFTNGQKKYMEAVMNTSLSDRKQIVNNQLSAFHTNYSNNINAPITTQSVVFTNGHIFSESNLNNGSIKNNVLKIELRGGLEFLVAPISNLSTIYYDLVVPPGLIANVNILDAKTAEIEISGIATNSVDDFETTFKLSNSVLNSNIPENLRSKQVKFDFLETIGIYENFFYSNIQVGPSSSNWTATLIENTNKYIYLVHSNNSFYLENWENIDLKIFTLGGKAKIFNDGNTLSGFLQSGNFEIDVTNIPASGDFYVGFSLPVCGESTEQKAWIKFKYDSSCNSISIRASGLSSIAGRTDEPVLLSVPSVISQNEDNNFVECEIELIKSNPNQKLKTSITSANIQNYITIGSVVKYNNINAFANNGFVKNDLKFTKLSDTKFSITANPNSTFWANVSKSFAFEIIVNENAFDLLGSSLTQVQSYIAVLIIPQYPIQYAEWDKEVSYTSAYDDSPLGIKFKDMLSVYSDDIPDLGFVSYNDGTDKGYIFYASTNYKFEAKCKPGGNELEFLNYGENFNSDNFKQLTIGYLSATGGLEANAIHLSSQQINDNLNSIKYVSFRFLHNCEIYYGWIKFNINNDGSLSDFEVVLNSNPDENLYVGQLPEACTMCTSESFFFNIGNFTIANSSTNIFTNSTNADLLSDYTNLSIPIDLGASTQYNFKASNTIGTPAHNGNWYAWIDYNRNGIYEENESIFKDESSQTLNINVEFPNHLTGSYTIRLLASYFPLNENLSGCQDMYYAEVEDYTIHFLNDCPTNLTVTDNLPQGDHKLQDYIKINTNASLHPNQASNMQAGYILLEENSLIEYGSIFCAEAIEECNTSSPKQAQLQPPTSTIKIYPNPFSQQSTLEFELSNDTEVSIFVSDITGKKLTTLADNQQKTAGIHQLTFNAQDIAPGIYYCTMMAGDKIQSQKMLITK